MTRIKPGTLVMGTENWKLSARQEHGIGLVVAWLPGSEDYVEVMWSVMNPWGWIRHEHVLDLEVIDHDQD